MTVPASGSVTVETVPPTGGSAITDTGLTLYSGSCTALTELDCDDDGSANGLYSLITVTGRTPGEVLYIRAWEFGGNSSGLIAVCVTTPSNCAPPTGPTVTNVTNTTAQLNWIAPAGSTAGITYDLEYGPQGFTLGSGTVVTGLTATSFQLTNLTASRPYSFFVRRNCGTTNGASAYVGPTSFTTPLTAPLNDEPCGAVALVTGTVNSSTVGATTSSQTGISTPSCAGGALPKDVWFRFSPSGTSTTLTITGTAAGALRVFTAPDCATGPFTQVFCQGASASNTGFTAPIVVPGLTPGQRYYAAVSGFASADLGGAFTLTATALLANRPQVNAAALLVYPNPSNTGQLALRLNGLSGNGNATLLNALGQVVRTQKLNLANEQTLTTRGLATGVYTLRVQAGADVFTRKVVLE